MNTWTDPQQRARQERRASDATPAAASDTDAALRWLVTMARFAVIPSAGAERLELCRWWTGGWADRLILRAETDAELQRITEVHPRQPTRGRLVRRDRQTVVGIAAVVQAWGSPTPTSYPLIVSLSRVDGFPTVGSRLAPALAGEGCA